MNRLFLIKTTIILSLFLSLTFCSSNNEEEQKTDLDNDLTGLTSVSLEDAKLKVRLNIFEAPKSSIKTLSYKDIKAYEAGFHTKFFNQLHVDYLISSDNFDLPVQNRIQVAMYYQDTHESLSRSRLKSHFPVEYGDHAELIYLHKFKGKDFEETGVFCFFEYQFINSRAVDVYAFYEFRGKKSFTQLPSLYLEN